MKWSLRRISPSLSLILLALSALSPVLSNGPTYFYITKPAAGDQWTQGSAHAASWIHAVDGVDIVDVELARMGSSGLIFAAREVPTSWGSLNLLLNDVPPGNDYYLVFLNVTHGLVYSISEKFTILPSTSTSANSSAQVAPNPTKPTVTITSGPGPLQTFEATFGPQAAGARSVTGSLADGRGVALMLSALAASILGGALIAL